VTRPTTLAGEAPAEARLRTALEWLGILGPIAALAAAVVFLANTSWTLVFESIHVLAAIVWVGGGAAIGAAVWRARHARDNLQLLQIARVAEWLTLRVFVPSALVVLAMGFVLMDRRSVSYGDFWPLFGLVGWGVAFVLSAALLGPQSGGLARLIEVRGPNDPAVEARVRRVLAVARIDVALVLLIAVDMVAKPFA
jgi:uncharacterized membrane protein